VERHRPPAPSTRFAAAQKTIDGPFQSTPIGHARRERLGDIGEGAPFHRPLAID
jgi:hypothetical protein